MKMISLKGMIMRNTIRTSFATLLLTALLLLAFAPSASAGPSFPSPGPFESWCWKYTARDGIEPGVSDGDWWYWGEANNPQVIIGQMSTSAVRSGTGAIRIGFTSSEPNGSWLVADRYITHTDLVNPGSNVARNSCVTAYGPQPTYPEASWNVRWCQASVWVRPTSLKGAKGGFALLTPDYYVIASTSFDIPVAQTNAWRKITLPQTLACGSEMIIRIGIERTSSSLAMIVDDVEILRAY